MKKIIRRHKLPLLVAAAGLFLLAFGWDFVWWSIWWGNKVGTTFENL